jgi:hypothetical protein
MTFFKATLSILSLSKIKELRSIIISEAVAIFLKKYSFQRKNAMFFD